MICKMEYVKGKKKGCDGAGTVWINNILVDCPKCSGKGEDPKYKNIPTYYRND